MLSLKQIPMRTLQLLLSCTLLAIFNLSCCHIKLPVSIQDEPLYFIKGLPTVPADSPDYAVQMFFLSSGVSELTKGSFDAISQGLVCMNYTAWEAFNSEIAKLCSEVKCDYKTLVAFHVLIAQIQAAAKEARLE